MENKEIQEEIIVDYVAKESAESSIMKKCFAWGIAMSYMAYTFYSIMTEFSQKQLGGEATCGLFLMLFFMLGVPATFMYAFLPYEGIEKEIEAARKFLLEAGQEVSKENINLLMNRYYKGDWQKIEDMLYEDRKVFLAENMKFISGNMSNENLKEAVPAK